MRHLLRWIFGFRIHKMAEAHESVVGIGEEKDEFVGLAVDGTAFDAATMISAAVMDRMANTPMMSP